MGPSKRVRDGLSGLDRRQFVWNATAGAALLGSAPAVAAVSGEDARDNAAITAVETRLVAQPGAPRPTLAARMAELKVPAVSIAFIEDGQVRWVRAYGAADADTGRRATPETMFQAASMSKAVASTGALALVEAGKLSLDEDVMARLQAWRVADSPFSAVEKVTLRRLLSHTAGLTVSGYPGYAAGAPVATTVESLSGLKPSATPRVRLFARPGEQLAYSGGGYTTAQLLMTEVSGESFPDLLERLVLRPSGMRRATFDHPLSRGRRGGAASGHGFNGRPIQGLSHTYPEYAAAGLWTPPSDYGRFVIAIQNACSGQPHALLTRETARVMTTPVLQDYALGLITGTRGGRPTIAHSGGNAGFRSDFMAFLDGSRQGAVVMTNGDNGVELVAQVLGSLGEAYGWPPRDHLSTIPRAPY
ncbi:hypothetical protein BH11PSE1_BH11PSE1_17530 [soil metagenome]